MMDGNVVLKAGLKVRITQQIAARDYSFSAPVEGTVVRYDQRPTGSWYAHGARSKLWLDRVVLRKSDGEMSTLNLDEFSVVDLID